jgi:Predicted acyltransferases
MHARLESFFLRKTSTARVQLDALDGLRGVAVLIVVLSHLSNARLFLIPGLDLSGTGKSGVFLFFVLSASD